MKHYHAMKICVLNLSGNVGKTTLAAHLLGAFRPNAKILSVESVNNTDATQIDSLTIEEFSAARFRDIYRELMMSDDLIVDVGASNVTVFMEELIKYRSAAGEFDLIVVPTVPADKQQKDTIATIEWLHRLGIAGRKIRVVFNQHQGSDTIDRMYAHIMGFALEDGKDKAHWMPAPVVTANDVYELIKATRMTMAELATDPTDWRARRHEARAAGDMDALELAMDGQIAHDLGSTAYANLQQAYSDLLAPYAGTARRA
ncbi:StbB family protein [Massilia sp. R2A-15]|uniref:StbB family protein n=1 Tax=Massilia sp. R2A-15 TaxID=3064278 RepID=UPI0027337860|nr:StbB family protein [Massilia sp. R2A-15]WLI87834.1 StbB family protein [Massilia sp. R2A-15]